MKVKSDMNLAYIAGFVDGEGYIGIKKYIRRPDKNWCPMYTERVSVAGINKKSIEELDDIVSGYIYYHKHSKISKKGYWSWEVTENNARKFIKLIYPYLRIKKPEADLVLKLGENKVKTNGCKVSDEDITLRENLYLSIKKIHKYEDSR